MPLGIYDLLGIALGRIRLSYDDFCRLDFNEFAAIYNSYATQRDAVYKDRWEQTRWLATIMLQPHLGKNKKLTPHKLLPFEWDKKPAAEKRKEVSPEEHRRRFENLVKRLGDKI